MRVYHADSYAPSADSHRHYGPIHRFDHHTPDYRHPAICPDGRSILYLGRGLSVCLAEVFGEFDLARLCPQHRIALIEPVTRLRIADLASQNAALRIGALPTLATGDIPRPATQAWARALWEQTQAHRAVSGVYYTAAYTGGKALALWNTEHQVRVVANTAGVVQDFAAHQLRERVVIAATRASLGVEFLTSCPH